LSNISSEILKKQIEELNSISNGFLKYCSLERYEHKYDAELVMQLGNTKLYCFGGNGAPIVIIPSMINKAYILDLKGNSFIKTLTDKHTVYLVDWCEPSIQEQQFYTYHYIEYRIKPFIEAVNSKHPISPTILGYCMGGILALLYASSYQQNIQKVITVAMPYNFDCSTFIKTDTIVLEKFMLQEHIVDPETLKAIFYINNFAAVHKKYADFASEISEQTALIENWVHDGVAVSKNVFFEFIDLLINKNSMFLDKQFTSCSITYNLAALTKTVIAIVGKYDTVVPLDSALAVQTLSDNVSVVTYDTGHVGQILKYASCIKDLI
jgi:poly(3-hydroxyalkanoate) synthetase